MKKGPQVKDVDAYPALLNDTIAFFKEIKDFFEKEVRLLNGPARAETRFVTAFIDGVALINIDKSLSKLVGSDPSKQVRRVVHYLSRAQEFLAKTTQNNVDGAQFIPVPFHQKIAEQDRALLDKCHALIERTKTVVKDAPENTKSWLSLYVNLANMLPDIRAAGFGLDIPQEHEKAKERLVAILQELTALEAKTDAQQVTKATKRKVGCESFTSVPTTREYFEHVPVLLPVFDSFKRMMQVQDKATITKDTVHAAVATEYPRPAPQ
ncbi:MAG: hypothetical protein JSR17_09765 [Proteobacteria bacterium]|nr:hypothetical protein [Pseudomonadota bacterium]